MTGSPVCDNVAAAECWNREVIRTCAEPFQPAGSGTAVLRGNLAPDGAIVKQSAASPHLLRHREQALVFESPEDYDAVAEDPELPGDETTVLLIRNCGPRGYPGMAEVANVALPKKLLVRGVRDMVRVCDGRMSGTAYGTVVLHVTPEAAVGGPLALVGTGDWIVLDVPARADSAGGRRGVDPAPHRVGPADPARQPWMDQALHRSCAAGRPGSRYGLSRRRQRTRRATRLPLTATSVRKRFP